MIEEGNLPEMPHDLGQVLNGGAFMSFIKKALAIIFVGILWTTWSKPAHSEGLSLAQVIANVEANEQLYHDIEVILTAHYRLTNVDPGEKQTLVTKQTKRRRSVSQGTMFYLKVSGGHDLLDTKSYDLNSLYGYDGQDTRYVEAGGPITQGNRIKIGNLRAMA